MQKMFLYFWFFDNSFLLLLFRLVNQGFTKSLAMTVLSEIGDKTFFAAAVSIIRYYILFYLFGLILYPLLFIALGDLILLFSESFGYYYIYMIN